MLRRSSRKVFGSINASSEDQPQTVSPAKTAVTIRLAVSHSIMLDETAGRSIARQDEPW